MKWRLIFNNDNVITPDELKRQLLDILLYGDALRNKNMFAEAEILWWTNRTREIEEKVTKRVPCPASGKNSNCRKPQHSSGKLNTITETGQDIQTNFFGNLLDEKMKEQS